MQSSFLNKFRRITYSTSYLPEIDGLRFLAIFMVVVVMHITHYLDLMIYNDRLIQSAFWKNFVSEAGHGVPLFFVISGFILSLPFAKWRLNNENKVVLKNYYIRRVFRLEPPYIIALCLLFIGHVWILHKYEANELFPHFMASVFYLHSLVYNSFSLVMPVAWSLEVEVQFYILAPLFCLVFLIRLNWIRWLIYTMIIIGSAFYWFDIWQAGHVFMYLHYFFSGIFLADLYCSGKKIIKNEIAGFIAGLIALISFIFIPSLHSQSGFLLKIFSIFFLVHTVLTNGYMKKIFSIPLLVIIGGMCYSIYLLHFAIVSIFGEFISYLGINNPGTGYFLPLAILFSLVVLIIAAAYFLLVEKPFMKPIGLPGLARKYKTKAVQAELNQS